jgi:hypothetical protein
MFAAAAAIICITLLVYPKNEVKGSSRRQLPKLMKLQAQDNDASYCFTPEPEKPCTPKHNTF